MRIRSGNWREWRAPVKEEGCVLHQAILEPAQRHLSQMVRQVIGSDSARQPIGSGSGLWHSLPRTWPAVPQQPLIPGKDSETARVVSRSLHPNIVSTALPKVSLLPLCRGCL